jgi:pimeloyl-ACP methyl ester carboxylesterase
MPERVVAVVGVDTLHDAERKIPPEQREALLGPLRADFPAGAAAFVRSMFPADADSKLVDGVASRAAAAPPAPAVAILEQLFAYDVAAGLAGVRAPIRCINSDRFPTNVDGARKHAKDFDAVILAGVGHFPHLEKPAEFNDALKKILAAVAPRDAR